MSEKIRGCEIMSRETCLRQLHEYNSEGDACAVGIAREAGENGPVGIVSMLCSPELCKVELPGNGLPFDEELFVTTLLDAEVDDYCSDEARAKELMLLMREHGVDVVITAEDARRIDAKVYPTLAALVDDYGIALEAEELCELELLLARLVSVDASPGDIEQARELWHAREAGCQP